MSEFSPPDLSTYYGADLRTATINYGSQQNREADLAASKSEARHVPDVLGAVLAADVSVMPIEGHLQSYEGNSRDSIADAVGMVEGVQEDSYGYKIISSRQVEVLGVGLDSLGLLAPPPTAEQFEVMHSTAAERLKNGTAESYLRQKPFLSPEEFYRTARSLGASRNVISWDRSIDGQLFIDPDKIDGVGADFHSWFGDSVHTGKNYTTVDGKPRHGSSQEAIMEYAVAYKTPLPGLEPTALNILITDDGPVCVVDHGAHRTAAAVLRGEPLGFSSFVLYDARSNKMHPVKGA